MTDLRAISRIPAVRNITLGGADEAHEIRLADVSLTVTLYFRTNTGKLATDEALVDGGPLGSAAYMTIRADTLHELVAGPDDGRVGTSLFVASATGGTVLEVMVEMLR